MEKERTIEEIIKLINNPEIPFNFDMLPGPSVYQILGQHHIDRLVAIATDPKLTASIGKKYKLFEETLAPLGFERLNGGTNRVVYGHVADPNFVLKISTNRDSMTDNFSEFRMQHLLKPFVTKVFSVDQSGVLGTFERVIPILKLEDFMYIVVDVIKLLFFRFLVDGRVADDIGIEYFKNYGFRKGFGPVLLDFPYFFQLDQKKLICNHQLPNGEICLGRINYDEGLNNLVCIKCNRLYSARMLQQEDNFLFNFSEREGDIMRAWVTDKDGNIIAGGKRESTSIIKPPSIIDDSKKPTVAKATIIRETFNDKGFPIEYEVVAGNGYKPKEVEKDTEKNIEVNSSIDVKDSIFISTTKEEDEIINQF